MTKKEVKEFREDPSKSMKLFCEAIENKYESEIRQTILHAVFSYMIEDIERSVQVYLSDEEKKYLRLFLQMDYIDKVLDWNKETYKEMIQIYKLREIARCYEDLIIYDSLIRELEVREDKLEVHYDVPIAELKRKYYSFRAGNVPSVCYEDPEHLKVYKELVKDLEESINERNKNR